MPLISVSYSDSVLETIADRYMTASGIACVSDNGIENPLFHKIRGAIRFVEDTHGLAIFPQTRVYKGEATIPVGFDQYGTPGDMEDIPDYYPQCIYSLEEVHYVKAETSFSIESADTYLQDVLVTMEHL